MSCTFYYFSSSISRNCNSYDSACHLMLLNLPSALIAENCVFPERRLGECQWISSFSWLHKHVYCSKPKCCHFQIVETSLSGLETIVLCLSWHPFDVHDQTAGVKLQLFNKVVTVSAVKAALKLCACQPNTLD